ncbi:hypothetical protein OAT02_15345 [Bacillus thuringiensis]|nr:hypothetical protein [Bacillus thuringiensis]UYC94538.1 hypothetical protein OAT02_15345 [Bacillus thuringiensis]
MVYSSIVKNVPAGKGKIITNETKRPLIKNIGTTITKIKKNVTNR